MGTRLTGYIILTEAAELSLSNVDFIGERIWSVC